MQTVLILIIAVLVILAAFKIFTLPIKFFLRLLASTLLGFILLFVLNLALSFIGFSIGINLLNALIVGILGLPGLALLILLKILLIL